MATIPPWIVTPDAAGRYMQGFSTGLNVASQRAEQAVRQRQMALQQQSMEQQRQTNAEIAARQAIQLALDEQFRKQQLSARATEQQLARQSAMDLLEKRLSSPTNERKLQLEAEGLMSQADQLEKSGDVGKAKLLRQQAANLEANTLPSGISLSSTPGGGFTFTQGRGVSKNLPQTIQTDAIKSTVSADQLYGLIDESIPKITPETVGIGGWLGKTFIDESPFGDLIPGLVNKDRVELVTYLNGIRAQVVRSMRSDGQINKDEREQLIESVPEIGLRESATSAVIKLNTIKKIMADFVRRNHEVIGQEIPEQFMKPQELVAKYKQMDLPEDEKAKVIVRAINRSAYRSDIPKSNARP